jgi:Immunity protein 8
MIAELKRLHSPDVADLRIWKPESDEFAILLQVMVAPEDSPGEESFDVTLCSPEWVVARAAERKILEGRDLLITSGYNYELIHEYISKYVSSCEGQNWQEVAHKLSRLGRWEFDEYTE